MYFIKNTKKLNIKYINYLKLILIFVNFSINSENYIKKRKKYGNMIFILIFWLINFV